MKHSDEICLHTVWPWILQPQSILLDIWEITVVLVVLLVAFILPAQIAFTDGITDAFYVNIISVLIDYVFLTDVFTQMFTAVDDGNSELYVTLVKVIELFTKIHHCFSNCIKGWRNFCIKVSTFNIYI